MAYFPNVQSSVELSNPLPTQSVTGFPISALSFSAQVETIIKWARERSSRMVCVSNVHMLMEGHWNPDFARVLRQSDLLTPDGMPLVWMTSLMKGASQDRVAGMELMLALCQQAQEKCVSVFFIGSTEAILKGISARLANDFPNLKVAGTLSPPFRELSERENQKITDYIGRSGAGLVFVSLGCPKQERWMSTHHRQVNAVMIGVGGVFSVYAGEKRWAPAWIRKYGLEWFYRLMQEPKRLWKRYALTIPPFLLLAMRQLIEIRLRLDSKDYWQ